MADEKPTERPDLRAENAALRKEVETLRAQSNVPPGAIIIPKGTMIHYVRGGEARCRKATVLSDGVVDRMTAPPGHPFAGNLLEYVHLAYNDHDPERKHTFETTRHRHPGGEPDTWHLVDECPMEAKGT